MNSPDNDIFKDARGRPRILRGVSIYSGSTWLAELAGRIGFETVWIEMEHGPADFREAETLCLAAQAGGAIPAIRVSDGQRTHILRALEVGGRIIIVPMVSTAAQAETIVAFGKFPPLGLRGYSSRSRGVFYGLSNVGSAFADANARTYLFAQIETREAVDNLDAICAVAGLAGIFIGPGDLSMSLGCTGDLNGAKVIDVVTNCIRRARAARKHAGILVSPGPLLEAAIEAGGDLAFIGGDVADLAKAWPELLESVKGNA